MPLKFGALVLVGLLWLSPACGPTPTYSRPGSVPTGLGGADVSASGGQPGDNGGTGPGGTVGGSGGLMGAAGSGVLPPGSGGSGSGGLAVGGSAAGGRGLAAAGGFGGSTRSGGAGGGTGGQSGGASGAVGGRGNLGGSFGTGTGGAGGAGITVPGTGGRDVGSGGTAGMSVGSGGSLGSGGMGGGGATGSAGTSGNGGAGGRGGSGPAAPVILSVDFVGGGNGANPVAMTATESAGVVAARNWNSASGNSGSKASLVFSDGTTTSASVTWNAPASGTVTGIWRLGYTDAPGDVRMMNGYLDPNGTATVAVSNLPAAITSGGYDVYVYTYGDVVANQTRSYGYAIGATSFTVTQTGPTANPFPGFSRAADHGSGTYVLFRKVTGAAFTLTATPADRAPINGLQIVWPASP